LAIHLDGKQIGKNEMTIQKVNLSDAFGRFSDHWSPKIVGDVNETQIKLAKFDGRFDWHHHADEDEMFLVISGRMRMDLHDGAIEVGPGEFIIIPKGTEHCPEAVDGECHIVLIERADTRHTGNVTTEKTVSEYQRLI
jgi:mannose-6-phosphate isomerase-like protein (cupin superfamily)